MLLHVCCAPCATYPVNRLRQLGFSVTGYWYNPNIHPWLEHEARRKSLVAYSQNVQLPVVWQRGYDIVSFLQSVAHHETQGDRCRVYYQMRLHQTAANAQRLGIPRFTTTLLVSPYQDQELIKQIGEKAAAAHQVEFYLENFRRGWPERSRLTREFGLYRQQYCGCVYSEFERFTGKPIAKASEISCENG